MLSAQEKNYNTISSLLVSKYCVYCSKSKTFHGIIILFGWTCLVA